MIDINELREAIQTFGSQAINEGDMNELLDRLEEAESDALEQARMNGMGASREAALMAKLEAAENERDVLRHRLALESQENGALRDSVDRACEERDELRARIEAMDNERAIDEQRIADLMAELNRVGQENEELRAKIETMEKQEPVKIQHRVPFVNSNGELVGYSVWIDGRGFDHWPHRSLYLAPGAQPAPSIPEISDDLIEAIESRAEQSYRRHHSGIRGQQVTPADALSWHIIHATRDVLATAPEEAKP